MRYGLLIRVIPFTLILIAISSCKTPLHDYHSVASLPLESYQIGTHMIFVSMQPSILKTLHYDSPAYAVAACVDTSSSTVIKYVLFCQLNKYPSGNAQDIAVSRSTSLSIAETRSFVQRLDKIIAAWDVETSQNIADFFELNVSQEQQVTQVSESVSKWKPSVKFSWSRYRNGSSAILTLGINDYQQSIPLDKDEVEDLDIILKSALAQLN